MQARAFDTENGFKLTIRVKSLNGLNDTLLCNESTQPITKQVRFIDSETRNLKVEVIMNLFVEFKY